MRKVLYIYSSEVQCDRNVPLLYQFSSLMLFHNPATIQLYPVLFPSQGEVSFTVLLESY